MIASGTILRCLLTWIACTFVLTIAFPPELVRGETKAEKTFSALVTDSQGVETELKHLLFYWEEKVSETAFVPHELKHVPVKRGTATVHVKFETIKQIEVAPGQDQGHSVLTITLNNGKIGQFTLGIAGSFKGESDFGELDLPTDGLKRILFK